MCVWGREHGGVTSSRRSNKRRPLRHSPPRGHLLWVQVAPSQPSLQTQVKDSPPATTQVPPFSHGFGRQLEFLAEQRKVKGVRRGEEEGNNRFCKEEFLELAAQSVTNIYSTSVKLCCFSLFLFFWRCAPPHPHSSTLCVYCQCNHGF